MILSGSQKLSQHILNLPDFPDLSKETGMERYNHMGAVIVDALLQPGLNYDSTVYPRVKKVQAIEEAKTTSGFLKVLLTNTPEKVLN
jgi:hypothetical protein